MGVDNRTSNVVPAGRFSAETGKDSRLSIDQVIDKYLRTRRRLEPSAVITDKFQPPGKASRVLPQPILAIVVMRC